MSRWPHEALGRVATIERDAIQPSDIRDETLYVGLEHIVSGGTLLPAQTVSNGDLASTKFQFTSAHILYGKLRPYLAKIAAPHFNGICSTDILPVLPGPDLDRKFLLHYLRQPAMVERAAREAVGANLPRLSPDTLARFEVPLPPLPEQRCIAAILDKAEALRAKRRAALAELDGLAQAIFLEMFGDPVSNPQSWKKCTLGRAARRKPNNGIFRKNHDYSTDATTGLPVVWVEELFRGNSVDVSSSRRLAASLDEVEKYGLKNGDLLFCRSSLKLDGIAYSNVYLGADDAALFECHVIRLSPDKSQLSPVYLNALLRLPQMRDIAKSRSKTSTMTTIDQQGIGSIPVICPPMPLQVKFAERIGAIQSMRDLHRAALGSLHSLFGSLQHRAFRGEL